LELASVPTMVMVPVPVVVRESSTDTPWVYPLFAYPLMLIDPPPAFQVVLAILTPSAPVEAPSAAMVEGLVPPPTMIFPPLVVIVV